MCFFFNDTATTEIYTLSLHDALPIFVDGDDDLHPWPQLRMQRIAAFGMIDGPADRGAPVGQLFDRRVGKDDARPDRNLLEEDLGIGEEHPRRGSLFLDDDLRVLVVALAQPVQRTHGGRFY